MEGEQRSIEEIAHDLRELGVDSDDLLMVHASLRAIGPVERRADGVIAALESVVAPDGTLLMVLGARDDLDWVNARPEPDRAELLRDAEPFDCLVTPADPDVGVLAEVFRTRAGTVVSDHPEGRFGASGRLARQLLDEVPWDDYYGPDSPLERFVRERGRVLRLGANLDTVTVIHYAEYLAAVPQKRRVRRHRVVAGADGPELRVVECLDDSTGIVDRPGEDYFAIILRDYLATGRAATGTVGNATSELIDAAGLVDFAVTWMTQNL